VIEIITFRLADGADEAAFLAADQRVQTDFFYLQLGMMRRTTARGTDGEWLVVQLWGRVEDADAATEIGNDHPAVRAFMSFIDGSTYRVKRYTGLD
jgi:hypothetical protein